ncbi:MAG: NUDIX domain-containing protein [Clostridiales bacterium]|jgi:8-oxo-dGTP diphosphatase|nr:NUDIX domain-containing protein [Clostridiales bacterium]
MKSPIEQVIIRELNTLKNYTFTVIFALDGKVGGQWLYCRHKNRDTWETAGGHIEPGETPLDCAKRELREETGAVKFYINPAFDYEVKTSNGSSYGQVFYADIEQLGVLPADFEMAEIKGFDTYPEKLTYPDILPVLYAKMQSWMGLDKAKAEYWDVYDSERRLTGRTHKRGIKLPDEDFHLVVRAWIVDSKGECLITRRALNKIGFPGMWEIPSGSVVAGEDSVVGVLRETEEESGIVLLPENGTVFSAYKRGDTFYDSWLFRQEFDLADVVLQEGETIDARKATIPEIREMMARGEFIGTDVFPEFELLDRLLI